MAKRPTILDFFSRSKKTKLETLEINDTVLVEHENVEVQSVQVDNDTETKSKVIEKNDSSATLGENCGKKIEFNKENKSGGQFENVVQNEAQVQKLLVSENNSCNLEKTKESVQSKEKIVSSEIIPVKYQPFPVPAFIEKSGRRKHQFVQHWYKLYPWLHYENDETGVLCFECSKAEKLNLLPASISKKNTFTTVGYKDWKKGKKKFEVHQKSEMHKEAVLKIYNLEKNESILVIMDNNLKKEQKDARIALRALFTTLQYLGQQGVATRGHFNDDGNYLALLCLRRKDIPELDSFLKRKKKFTSHDIQSEMLQLMANQLLRKILDEVRASELFSLIADETTDVSKKEQVSISVRIVSEELVVKEFFLGFYETVSTTGESLAKILLDALIRLNLPIAFLRGQCYDGASNMKGIHKGVQAKFKEKQPLALYVHCTNHSLNLALQDSVRTIPLIRDCLQWVHDVAKLYSTCKRRNEFLEIGRQIGKELEKEADVEKENDGVVVTEKKIEDEVLELGRESEEKLNEIKGKNKEKEDDDGIDKNSDEKDVEIEKKLKSESEEEEESSDEEVAEEKNVPKSTVDKKKKKVAKKRAVIPKPLCPTRWTVRKSSLDSVLQTYPVMLIALEEFSLKSAAEVCPQTLATARGLYDQFSKSETFFGLLISSDVFGYCDHLATVLQCPRQTVSSALSAASKVLKKLQMIRNDEAFEKKFKLLEEAQIKYQLLPLKEERIRRPPIKIEHTNNPAPPAVLTPKENLKKIYFELIDNISNEISTRIDQNDLKIINDFEKLLLGQINVNDVAESVNKYGLSKQNLKLDLEIISRAMKKSPKCFRDYVKKYTKLPRSTKDLTPTLKSLIRLLMVIPCSVATAERSFSTLRRLKDYLRNTMEQSRLNHLAMLHIYKNLMNSIDIDELCEEFIKANDYRGTVFGTFSTTS